jgi:PAS domain S-box-containing protein
MGQTGPTNIHAVYSNLAKLIGDSGTFASPILDAFPDCIKLLDLNGDVVFMNESGKSLMEIDDVQAFVGKPWATYWPDDQRKLVENAIAEAQTGNVSRFSGHHPTAKGTKKWWDVVVSPVYDNANRLVWLLSVSRDNTKQRSAEERLVLSEQRFHALADNIAQLAWMADATGWIFWYNQRWFDYTGTTLDETAGWGWRKVHHPGYVDRVVEKISACFQSGEAWEDTFPLRSANGDYRWFLSRAMPIRNEFGKVNLWFGTNTDITEQRNTSQRFKEMAQLIELSHEALIVWDFENGIILWNRGCEDLYGYSRDEAIGATSHELLKTRFPDSREAFESAIRNDRVWSGELLHVSKHGEDVWVESRQELLQFGERCVVLESDRDVRERRRAVENANLLIGELNHRVNNTLSVVQAIVSQTARKSSNMQEFVASFTGRLRSLATAHNLLANTQWTGVELRELINVQLASTIGDLDNVEIVGSTIFLPPQTVLQLTLILHELAANAIKHGSLSRSDGRLFISWTVDPERPHKVNLVWREEGGPPVSAPTAIGFGRTLIERSGHLPCLEARLLFQPGGVECRIVAAMADDSRRETPYFKVGKFSRFR